MKAGILIFFMSISAIAAETIPFIVRTKTYQQIPLDVSFKREASKSAINTITQIKEEESIVQIATDKITKAVQEVRTGVCSTLKHGHIKMWFKATAKGNLIVSETSGEGGLEVQFDCKD